MINTDMFHRDGYLLQKQAVSPAQVKTLIELTEPLLKLNRSYGVRNLLDKNPAFSKFATSGVCADIIHHLLGEKAAPVRAIFFDKVPEANWNVAWHQDTTIAVTQKHELEGYGPWSVKQGVPHVEPPVEILQHMVTLRIHLDPTGTDNGALRVIPESHKNGRMNSAELLSQIEHADVIECEADPGDILVMRPLLLHASRKSTSPTHRRIIHIEYCAAELDTPLQWYETAGNVCCND